MEYLARSGTEYAPELGAEYADVQIEQSKSGDSLLYVEMWK